MIVLIVHVGQAISPRPYRSLHNLLTFIFLHNYHSAKEYWPLKISACVSSGQLSSDYGTPGNTFGLHRGN
jgi:hypothetical protein